MTHQFVAVLLVESLRLKGVGEVDGLCAPAGRRLGFGGGDEPGREALTAQTWLHPEVLQLAAVAPGPSADTGDDPAGVANEDRQVDFVTEPGGGGRLTTYLRFEDIDVQRIRVVLDVEIHSDPLVRRRPSARSARRRRSTSGTTGSSPRGSRPRSRPPSGRAVPLLPTRHPRRGPLAPCDRLRRAIRRTPCCPPRRVLGT